MYSTEPEKARPDGVEGEVLSTFKLAGSRGNLRTVLTQDHVTLELKSGSFETLINLVNEGPWMTILPYLQTLNLSEKNIKNLEIKHINNRSNLETCSNLLKHDSIHGKFDAKVFFEWHFLDLYTIIQN